MNRVVKVDGYEVHVGGTYRHFKGGLYKVLNVARNAETNEMGVIYRSKNGMTFYFRSIEDFMSDVDTEKHPNAKQTKRFVEVQG